MGWLLGGLSMRRVPQQQDLLCQTNSAVHQQRGRENEEMQQRYLVRHLQEEVWQRQILNTLQSHQSETRLQHQHQRLLGLQPIVDVADEANVLTSVASLQLNLYQQRRNL